MFSSNATNFVVTDGTTSGLNTYADIVGVLNTASVGTTAAAAVTTSPLTVTSTSIPLQATPNTSGQYTFTPNAPGDTLTGRLTWAVGTNGSQASVNLTSPTSLTALKNLLNGTASFTGAGLQANLNGGSTALIITGPQTNADAAANTVSFAGSSLVDNVGTVSVNNGVTAAAPTQTQSSLTFAGTGVAAGDSVSGSLTYQVGNGTAQTFTLAANSTINANAPTDISAQLNNDATFKSYGLTASVSGTTLTVKGPAGNTENIVLGTGTGTAALTDTSHSGTTTTNNSITGSAGTAGTDTLTFAATNSAVTGSININGESISGANANAIYTNINADTNLQTAGITATISSNVVTIHGNPTTGTAPTIGANSLNDSGLGAITPTTSSAASILTKTIQPFSSGSAAVIGGTIVIDGKSIAVQGGPVNGTTLAQQINTAMQTTGDGITASFNSATATLTINGNANGSTLPSIDASGLTDSGSLGYNNTPTATIAPQTLKQSVQTITFSDTATDITGAVTVGGTTLTYAGGSPTSGSALATALNTALQAQDASEGAVWDAGSKTITITGPSNGTETPAIDVSGLSDNSVAMTNGSAVATVSTNQQLVVGAKTLAAFSSPTAAVVGGSITVDGYTTNVTGAPVNGTALASQINATLTTAGVNNQYSASFNTTSGVLTINGPSDGSGSAPSVVSNLTDTGDINPYQGTVTTGSPATAATASFAIGAGDSLSGSIEIAGQTVNTGSNAAAFLNNITSNAALVNAGITATYSAGTLTVTANPTAGVGLNIQNNNLVDAAKEAVSPATVLTAVAGAKTTSSIALGDTAQAGDVLTGSLTYTVGGGTTNTFNIANGTTLDNNGSTGISTLLNANSAFQALNLHASVTGTTLTITGPAGSTSTIALNAGTLTDVTHNLVASTANDSVNGNTGTAATKTLVLNSNTDTFGGSIDITSGTNTAVAVDLSGLNGSQAALAITNNATLLSQGVSASWNSNNSTLTILGNNTGQALAVAPVTTVADNAIVTDAVAQQPTGGPAAGATSTIHLGSANDTVSGTLSVVVGNTGLARNSVSLVIAPNTTGASLATQINSNTAFQVAGVSAAYNSNTHAVTLTGPTGLTNTLDTSASTLTDASSAVPQGGANFTAAGVSTLTAQTASNVLTTVTAAVADVAYQRGTLGADINQRTSASNVASAESVNLTSAQQSITATDYGQAASNLSKYQILSQTGISALAQANSVQQEVLKLLQ